jgi:hypothetical protein
LEIEVVLVLAFELRLRPLDVTDPSESMLNDNALAAFLSSFASLDFAP